MAAEIIRVEVLKVADGRMEYRDVMSRARGLADLGHFELPEGIEALIEIDSSASRQVIRRVLEPVVETYAVPAAELRADDPPILVNGAPLPPQPDETTIEVGQVRTAEIPFTSFRTGGRDRGRTAKRRPCVVVELDADHAAVCPIHRANSAVGRSESGRKLLGWHSLGLKKPSSVNSASVWVARDSLGDLIGVLDTDDRRRLGL